MRGQLERIVFWSLIPSENLIAVYLFEYKKIITRTLSKQICIEKNETLTLFNSIQIVKMVI